MPSLFIAIYVAIYPYTAQSAQELSLVEGDVLYILEKSTEDDWWRVKKRMVGEEEDEPIGLVPNNYIEPMKVSGKARAMYDYDRQTDEEVNLREDEVLEVYDTSDPDWVLVGVRDEFGFAPSNYIEFISEEAAIAIVARASATPTTSVVASRSPQYQPPPQPQPVATPYAQPSYSSASEPVAQQDAAVDDRYTEYRDPEPEYDDDLPDEEPAPKLPSRPRMASVTSEELVSSKKSNAGFLTWNIQEVDSKRKKYRATLAIGNGSILFSPERATASPQQWSITNLISYNSEKKHVFLEFEHPSVSLDLHAGSKETAAEIISAIGELVGAKNATGLREVIEASVPGGQKYGKALYDFDAQGDDEVTIREGDDVFILDDQKSDEWWMIRHSLSGKEGVVPSSYIEVIKKPVRSSSLRQEEDEKPQKPTRKQRESEVSLPPVTPAKPKPDPGKIRTWTDRTGTFKVEAAFVGCADNKIQLHKVNGVKIAVAASKMSVEDLEYVERITGISLDSAKPEGSTSSKLGVVAAQSTGAKVAELAKGSARPDFDWFDFFLSCGVEVNNCQRYAINFEKDQMDEAVLPDITPSVMRMLGLKEGDIIRVSKVIDEKYNKKKRSVSFGTASVMGGDDDDSEADGTSLFAGPGGALKNNTRKSRPAPAVATSSTVDGKLLSSKSSELPSGHHSPTKQQSSSPTPQTTAAPEPLRGALRDLADINPLTPAQAISPERLSPATATTTVQSAPVIATSLTGHQGSQTPYVPLQPKLVYEPTPPQSSQTQNVGVQYPQPTGMLDQAQLSPPGQSPVVSISTGEIPLRTGFPQQQHDQQQRENQQEQQQQQLQLQLQLQQHQEAQVRPQVFYGVQRPPPPQSQPQALGAFGALSMPPPPPPQPSRPTSNGGIVGFPAQPTGFHQQVPLTTGFPVQVTGYPNPPLGFGMNAFASPPALQPQPTRPFVPQSQFGIQQMHTGFQVASFQHPPSNGLAVQTLQPQPTGFGFGNGPSSVGGNGAVNGGGSSAISSGINSVLMKPLEPMKTGPAPKVSFGINKPVEATPTGNRKANLAAASTFLFCFSSFLHEF
ncbi:hypothetical protein V1517DRAFT_98004 [Lipomyces orientalis]|uniref:Uncharacterized protein n=1 Tax=Lipomyces orientalis TaxID=1233043 RepID=A0ACC3TRE9_9ASCO